MAKLNDTLTAKQVAVVEGGANTVMIGDKSFTVVNRVNVPTLKHEQGEVVTFRIDAPIREEIQYKEEEVIVAGVKQVITRENTLNVVRITELTSGQPYEYVCNAMTADNLRGTYPEATYVGRSFAILKKGRAPGKQYIETEVVEIAAA